MAAAHIANSVRTAAQSVEKTRSLESRSESDLSIALDPSSKAFALTWYRALTWYSSPARPFAAPDVPILVTGQKRSPSPACRQLSRAPNACAGGIKRRKNQVKARYQVRASALLYLFISSCTYPSRYVAAAYWDLSVSISLCTYTYTYIRVYMWQPRTLQTRCLYLFISSCTYRYRYVAAAYWDLSVSISLCTYTYTYIWVYMRQPRTLQTRCLYLFISSCTYRYRYVAAACWDLSVSISLCTYTYTYIRVYMWQPRTLQTRCL